MAAGEKQKKGKWGIGFYEQWDEGTAESGRNECGRYDSTIYEQIFAAAHTLKGVAGNLGMIRVYEFLVVIVEKIRNANYEELDVLYIKFKNECDRLQGILG